MDVARLIFQRTTTSDDNDDTNKLLIYYHFYFPVSISAGLDSLLDGPQAPSPVPAAAAPAAAAAADPMGGLNDLFGLASPAPGAYVPAKACWLAAAKGKGLEIWGSFCRKQGQVR